MIRCLWVDGGSNDRGWGRLSFAWRRELRSASSVPVRGGRAPGAPGERPPVPASLSSCIPLRPRPIAPDGRRDAPPGHAPRTRRAVRKSSFLSPRRWGVLGAARSSPCSPAIPRPSLPAGTQLNVEAGSGSGSQPVAAQSLRGVVVPGCSLGSGHVTCSRSQAVNRTARTFLPGLCVQVLSKLFSVMSQFLFGAFFFFFPNDEAAASVPIRVCRGIA